MNYNLTNEWQPLSEIMGSDYSATVQYRININLGSPLCVAFSEDNTSPVGAKTNLGGTILVDVGEDIYLKVLTLNQTTGATYDNAIYVSEVA